MGRKVVRVADTFWPGLLGVGRQPCEVTEDGLPPDAVAINASHDGRTTSIVFESESFPPTPDGQPYPELVVKFRQSEE